MALRQAMPLRALLTGASQQHGALLIASQLELQSFQSRWLIEALSTAATVGVPQHEHPHPHPLPQPAPTCAPQHVQQLQLLPPLLRMSLAAQAARGFHTSRSLDAAFQPTAPALFPADRRAKDGAAAGPPKAPAPLPKAEDCDTAIRDYEDLHSLLDRLERPASLKSVGAYLRDAASALLAASAAVGRFLASMPGRVAAWRKLTPEEWAAKRRAMWAGIKHEAHHYWVGFKLLAYEVRLASGYALKAARGEALTRRERRQLTRTTADLFRLVPLVIIVVIPFLEFALPLLLRIFPNMLPSTFEDKLKKEEEMKRRLAVKLELARFLQDTVSMMAKDLQRTGKGSQAVTANELYEFIQRVRAGAAVENHELLRFAQLFNDALTLDNLERVQLASMAQFVGISPFGTDQFLRNRLRAHLQQIKHDDYEIEREGLENLTEDELRQACRARGMRAPFGEGAVAFMRRQLQDWLDLSLHRGLPSSLLLLSRAFTITASVKDVAAKKDLAYEKLKETLSVIPEEVVEQVEYEALGGPAAATGAKALEKKLEFLKREEEIIKEEAVAAKAAAVAEEAKAKAVAAAAAAAALTATEAVGATAAMAAQAAGARAAVAAAAAAAAQAGGEGGAAAAGGPVGLPEAARATAAALVGGALHPELAQALTVEALSEEERAAKEAAAREARVSAILEALLSLTASSGVARERALFLELVRNEMARLNKTIAEKGGSTGSMAFSSSGLEVAAPTAPAAEPEEAASAAGAAGAAPPKPMPPPAAGGGGAAAPAGAAGRLSARVAKMLHSIEQELDKAEASIGDRLQLLDSDRDGVISRQELQAAVSFLKAQLDPADLDLLFSKLGAAAGPSADPSSPIRVEELLAAAQQALLANARGGGEGAGAGPGAGEAAEGGEGSGGAKGEVVKIHTM